MGGSHCLDLFAGSGALGFEAASRGASRVDMVEADRTAFGQLKTNQTLLQAEQCQLSQMRAEQFLQNAAVPFDIVFIDPPYQANLWTEVARLLVEKGLLKNGSRIYLEYPRKQAMPELPSQWQLLKEKQAGDVKYCLFEHQLGDEQ